MGLGLNFVVGYAGLLDLGYVAFFAAGAYVAGWLGSQQFAQVTVSVGGTSFKGAPGIHLNPWLVILVAAIFAALLGVLIGIPTLRLRGDYLAIVTLGFGEIIPQFVRNGDNLGRVQPHERLVRPERHRRPRLRRPPQHVPLPARQLPQRGRLHLVLLVGPRCWSGSRSAPRSCCATAASGARGSRSARTRTQPGPWACP